MSSLCKCSMFSKVALSCACYDKPPQRVSCVSVGRSAEEATDAIASTTTPTTAPRTTPKPKCWKTQ